MASTDQALARAKTAAGVEVETTYSTIKTPSAGGRFTLPDSGDEYVCPKFWMYGVEFVEGVAVTKNRRLAVRIAREFPSYTVEPALTPEELGPRAEPEDEEDEDY